MVVYYDTLCLIDAYHKMILHILRMITKIIIAIIRERK